MSGGRSGNLTLKGWNWTMVSVNQNRIQVSKELLHELRRLIAEKGERKSPLLLRLA